MNTLHTTHHLPVSAFAFASQYAAPARWLLCAMLLTVAVAAAVPVQAQQTQQQKPQQTQADVQPVAVNPVVFSQTAEIEREVTDPDGSRRTVRVPAVKVPPGDEVIYTARIRNNGSQPLTGIRIDTPIPEHTTLVQNSVSGSVAVTCSVDGGSHFAPLAALTVTRDGNSVPATAADVTHLRLQPDQPLLPGTAFTTDYRVTVD